MPTETLWTVAEFSAVTKLARSTIYEWCHMGYVPHIKVGDCIRFRPAEVMSWLDAHAKPGRVAPVFAVEV